MKEVRVLEVSLVQVSEENEGSSSVFSLGDAKSYIVFRGEEWMGGLI